MPFGSVQLLPGVNVERTPTALKAGYSATSLGRFKDSLFQKLGGWVKFFPLVISGVPRDLHVWEDLREAVHLLIGSTNGLNVLTSGSLQNITPQTFTSDFTPNFSTTMSSPTVEIVDPNIINPTLDDSVFFNTPISVGGLVLFGMYPIVEITGINSYNITASSNATSNVSNGGAVPVFTTSNGSATVEVTINNHGIVAGEGESIVFQIPTTGNGVTIANNYLVNTVVDANNFNIIVSNQATASSSFSMNAGKVELVYYIALGPPPVGSGYGLGGYGTGGYGLGTSGGSSVLTGTPITATDWTSANWGEIALACPQGGGIYEWDPSSGFINAGIIPTAPTFCGGMFVSTSVQIAVAWGSSFAQAIGIQIDPLFVQWSTEGDFTNWTPTAADQAGGFRIPLGSKLQCGIATPTQNVLWTDLDCWAMNYLGPPLVYGFNNIGAGAGAISSHAALQLRGNVFWMGFSNFYAMTPSGVQVLPCPVWDFVFQNINLAFAQNVRQMPNTNFNEAGWLFPSNASVNGENDCYVKMNITEPGQPWDFGPSSALPRSAWTDQSILGPPISASPSGIIYQQETGFDADGMPLQYSFTTGYFFITEGEDFAFIDQIYPDFKWGFYGQSQNSQVQITINAVNYPGDTPEVYGPFLCTQSTEFISVRIRARQLQFVISGDDLGSFMRLGYIRYRYRQMGRR